MSMPGKILRAGMSMGKSETGSGRSITGRVGIMGELRMGIVRVRVEGDLRNFWQVGVVSMVEFVCMRSLSPSLTPTQTTS